jgi:hypothetical protein
MSSDSFAEPKELLSKVLDELLRRVALFHLTGNTQLWMNCNQGGIASSYLILQEPVLTCNTRAATPITDSINPKWCEAAHVALDEALRRIRQRRITGKCSLRLDWNQGGLRAIRLTTEENFTVKGQIKDALDV